MQSTNSSGSEPANSMYANAFKIKILAYDSYQTAPSPLDKSYSTITTHKDEPVPASYKPFLQVPILRIFGKVETGHSILLNVHNCFPYVFVEYDGDLKNHADVVKMLKRFKLEIEKQLYLSFKHRKLRKPSHDSDQEDELHLRKAGHDGANDIDANDTSLYENKFVCSLDLVKSVPFYGYHIGYKPYVKISLLNPRYITRLCSILQLRKVFGKNYQPHEAHIPYLLQFMTDFNLYACDWLYLNNYIWRSPVVAPISLEKLDDDADFDYSEEELDFFNQMKTNSSLKELLKTGIAPFKGEFPVENKLNVVSADQFPRIGATLLEIDCLPQWIVNRSTVSVRDLHHDFVEIMQPLLLKHTDSYVDSTGVIMKDIQHQRNARGLDNASFLSKLSLMYDGDVRDYLGDTDWLEQQELDDMLRHCIDLSNNEYREKAAPAFDTFVKNSPFYDTVLTPMQSIENGLFRLVRWSQVHLLDSETFQSITSSPEEQVLPSSMFESVSVELQEAVELTESDDEMVETGDFGVNVHDLEPIAEDDREDNWMGTVPPHRSQDLEDEKSMTTDPDLDRSDLELFKRPNVHSDKNVSFSIDKSWLSQTSAQVKVDLGIFKSRQKPSAPTPLAKSSLEFVGTAGLPPNDDHFMESFSELGLLKVEYDDPYYSKVEDIPSTPFIFAGKKMELSSKAVASLPPVVLKNRVHPSFSLYASIPNKSLAGNSCEFRHRLPSFKDVDTWLQLHKPTVTTRSQLFKSQILDQTPTLKHGFKYHTAEARSSRKSESNYMISLAIEIHVNTRDGLKPDPAKDEICAIFWTFDKSHYPFELDISESGILIKDSDPHAENKYLHCADAPIAVFENEISMVRELVSIVTLIDPDLLCGYEIHSLSWGYIIERFRTMYDIDLCSKLSRVVFKGNNKFGDRWGYTHASAIKITGRHMMNLWRILRSELNLLRYTIENVVFHTFHIRIPHYSEAQLTEWWGNGTPKDISIVLNYFLSRVKLNLEIVERLEIISKTTEQARLIGVDFYSVFYRGSQFKVESFLVRLTKSENFMLISPSKQQVFKADALQCIPLIMEPSSGFYKSPLVVLDFQSLYPSIIIAYNYCYSTLMGRLRGYNPKLAQPIGVTKNKLEPGLLELLKDHLTISPNGLLYLKANVRKSLLAKMLTEILETRILVKETMKNFQNDDHNLSRLYNSRQLALKLLANVTYGYTSATFSGRMPCADIADSIVSSGRETLNKAIREIENNSEWGAKVIYGDTDSLFVYFPGKTKADAFYLGRKIANHITLLNPKPVKLKFEKVYHPCVLLSKKRYVGYSYTNESQITPDFDAKGIETVRRDGIPAQQKIVEKCLRILFETQDLSQIKSYVQDQFLKIISNKVSLQDFCFAKEVRVGTYKDERYAPAGAHVSKRLMEQDERAEPQYRERVPYVVIQSYKGERLRDRCVTPQFFLENEVKQNLQLDAEYYITKALIPPLERILNLVGVDVRAWYREMPRLLKFALNYEDYETKRRKLNNTLHAFLTVPRCLCCRNRASKSSKLCASCKKDELATVLKLQQSITSTQTDLKLLMTICRACSSSIAHKSISDPVESGIHCVSDDCPIFYSRLKAIRKFNTVLVREGELLSEMEASW